MRISCRNWRLKFSWIFLLTSSLYYLKTFLQPIPSLNYEINQSFLVHSRLKKVRNFFNIWAVWTFHCSGYTSPPCSRQHVQTFLPLTSVAEVMELVAAGSRETSKWSLPSADPVVARSKGHPWRHWGAARMQGATTQGRQWNLGQQCHQLRRCGENGGTVQRLKPGGKKKEKKKIKQIGTMRRK